MRELLHLFLAFLSLHLIDTCIRTVPTPTPGGPCGTCTANQITFTPRSPDRIGSIDATFTGPTTDADGCVHLEARCVGDDGFESFMQFNINQGGPEENNPAMQIVQAPLDCRNGQWFYRNRPIDEVNCQQAQNG